MVMVHGWELNVYEQKAYAFAIQDCSSLQLISKDACNLQETVSLSSNGELLMQVFTFLFLLMIDGGALILVQDQEWRISA